jgi:hypothetical protein
VDISFGGKDGRYVELTTWTPSWAVCPEILTALISWNPKSLYRNVKGWLYITCRKKVKVKQPRNRPGVVQRVTGGLGSQIS